MQVLGLDRGFLVAIEFLVLCRKRGSLCYDMVLRCRQLLGLGIIFSCCDSALFLCRDDVAIEVSLLRLRRPRQEVRRCKRFGLGKSFHVATEYF